jgi:hypothetical protein
LQDFAERRFEIFLNVIAQGFERRDVEHFGAVGQVSREGFADKPVDADEKRRESLSRASRGRDQRRLARENVRPALRLRLGRSAETPDKPLLDERMSPLQAGH